MERAKGLVAHLVVNDANRAIEYYKKSMGAIEVMRMPANDGKRVMHAQLKIGDSYFFVMDDFPEYSGGKSQTPDAVGRTPMSLFQYVLDCDAAIARCVEAGATVKMPAADQFWGDRYGQVVDPSGHLWAFGTPIKT